jgi:hypothetical protein
MLSKTRFVQFGLNYPQRSNTPVLQYSGTVLSVRLRWIICDLAHSNRFLLLE